MYDSTSLRWIVHTLLPNRTYERQSWSCAFDYSTFFKTINPAAVVAATNFDLDAGK